jgi:N-acetylmuramoyl-L-alanine amidase
MIKRYGVITGISVFILISAIVVLIVPIELEILALKSVQADILLIDPGHGGIDSGAVGQNGICEKNINLKISMLIKDMAEQDGWDVVMTREEDEGLYPKKDRQSIRSLKTADLMARKKMIEDVRPLLAVSVHLNSFKQDPNVRGAQTFYPGTAEQTIVDESKHLAECVQRNLVEGLDDGTDRAALSKSDVFLLKNPKVPIIIVECGFLSNPVEESLLNQNDYQLKVAECVYRGIMEFSGKEKRTPIEIIDNRS